MIYLRDPDVTLYHGDALEILRGLLAESVHCCVASPPFYGLRDYGVDGQIGLEETPELWVQSLVEVFREVKRVLRADGTLWLECGDSFLPRKQLGGMPWKLAFALQADDWILRSDIIWARPNPMPESVTDRPTKSHSYLFLLTKSARYYFDQETVREPHSEDGRSVTRVVGQDGSLQHRDGERWPNSGRNTRSVWTIPTQPYPEAHFATFPEELARRCIAAGTSERGCCPECGAPWVREVEREHPPREVFTARNVPDDGFVTQGARRDGELLGKGQKLQNWLNEHPPKTKGWRPSCSHGYGQIVGDPFGKAIPCGVLDPFVGSGTVPYVARKLGRHAIGIDLNAEYLKLAAKRLQQQSLFAEMPA